jgi:hypothetical protein
MPNPRSISPPISQFHLPNLPNLPNDLERFSPFLPPEAAIMSTSFVWPGIRPVGSPAKTRPIPRLRLHSSAHQPRPRLTVVRPGRVGVPTTDRGFPAVAPLPDLVDDAVTAALSGMEVLEQNVPVVAAQLRTGREWDGNLGLASVMQITRTLVTLAATVSHLTGHDQALQRALTADAELQQGVEAAVEAMVVSQQAGDWTVLADTLEHRFLQALRQWRPVFESFRAGDPEPEPDNFYGLAG